ncbi:hypothetical protein PFICI_09017 [Pestalotiopsis fici W106-1]|uniref:Fungal N-terminal domain-containing protein n=1 Tax=Pestalotiopsis fici (strain W106-1 / CGMCC3.15140) TaxID=1229662 RepID=W3WZE6_PESFW|nr:uncharacterized protein PFICI_09017 [Pestalotiopsis fici W106-1]ETS79164.1 hypothetical protein PFICI_09017 [Pestalotiopsis fici W106-1]
MDPLSLAASVAGLISLADVVFRYVYKYGKAAAGAKQEVLALSQEINNLSSLLRTLEALASDLEDGGDEFNPALRSHLLVNCKDTLEKIRGKLKKATDSFQARSKLSGVTRQLKWPFAASETKELMVEISRYKETMTLAISSDSMRQLQLSLAKQDEHGKQIAAIHTITKRIEINTQILVNNEKRRVLDFFMPAAINPQSNLEHNIRLRHPVTGMWLVESDDLTKWIQTPGSKLWLSGIPGGGKTVLAAAVIQEALARGSLQHGVAFFFCDYKNEDTWKPLSVLGAIVSQLARQKDEAFDMLKAYFDTLHPERGLEKAADLEELRLTIAKMAELFDQVTVIIDGLDECGDQTDDVVDSIAETAENSHQITIALFSRDEINIRLRLEDEFKHIPIAATTGDIDLFVGAEIQQRVQAGRFGTLSTALKDEIRERLVEGANGMFRWVVCQLDYLGEFATDTDRRQALHELPPTLHGSYMRLLERLSRLPERIQSRVQMCLQFIASSNHFISTIGTLRQAVSDFASTGPPLVETNLVSEREIEYRCSSLIRKSKDGNSFEFAHFSVKEFLESPSISENPKFAGYHISKHRYQQLLTSQCLKLVHLSNVYEQQHGTPPDFLIEDQKQSGLYRYACSHWPYVIREGLEDPSLVQLCHSLVSSTSMQTINSTSIQSNLPFSWKIFFKSAFVEYLRSRYSSGSKYQPIRDRIISEGKPEQWFEPLHLAAALNMPEVCLSLLKAGANPNHRCPYGTPIDLAMRAILAFMPWDSAWNEDEPQAMGWGRPQKHWKVIKLLVPAVTQRNRTIEILIQAGSELSHDRNPALDLGKESIFSTVSVIASHTKDFNPVVRLMSLGITPSDSELDALEGYLKYWNIEKSIQGDSQVRDRSLFDLLVYLDSTGAYDSAWGIRMGSIVWSTASAVGSAFTKERNLGIIDTRISLSKDGLVQQALAAIRRDDSTALKTCLDDNRLDLSQVYTNRADVNITMVELAALANAVGCLEVLLDFGSNAGIDHTSAPSTKTLIRRCIRYQALGSLRILVDHGASLLAVDSDGMTIFHICANEFGNSNVGFFGDVLEIDPLATVAGLVMRMPNGETPLDLLLLRNKNHKEIEQMTLLLMDWCDKIPKFWLEDHQLFTNAAAIGSATIIRRLLDMGAKPEPLGASNFLPLHNVNARATLEFVRLLKSLHGEVACAVRARPDMCLPVELYIMHCVHDAIHPDEAIVHELLTPEVITPTDPTMGTLWRFCCETIPVSALKWTQKAKLDYLDEDERLSEQLLLMLQRLGCMDGYEKSCSQSALIPLFKGVLDGLESDWFSNPTLCISPNEPGGITQLAFDSTKYWDTAKTSPTTIRLFKQAIADGHGELVSVLLRRGVDVHQRQDGVSAVEFLCLESQVMTNHATAKGRGMISEVLDHTNLESLNEVEFNKGRLGLLHMITSCAEPGPAWLMSELVKRGVDIERKCATTRLETPLLYHLHEKSFDVAQLLVELGASYGNRMSIDKRIDVPQLAAYRGAHTFLQFLLAHSVKNSIEIVWDRPCEESFEVDKDEDDHKDVTALHFAAEGGSVDCLQLFYDKGLLKEFEPRTSRGWTPLHCAASNDSFEAIEFLVSKGANVNALANDKSSPLHIAVRCGHLDSVKTLLRLGAMRSRDSQAMTPRAYAVGYSNRDIIVVCLDEAFGPESEVMPSTVPWSGMKHIFQSLETAIERDDVEECKRLQNLGCPLNASMPSCHGCSPLMVSLAFRSRKVAGWMLENGASTLKVKCDGHSDSGNYATEIAAETKELTTVLPHFLERHHDEGGDLIFGDEYPLHYAVYNKNIAAVELILRHVEDNKSYMGRRAQLDPELVKSTIINRLGMVEDKDTTPLHLAVENKDLDMISLLVENGARIDALDDVFGAPLSYTSSEPVAIRLVELGASLGPLYEDNSLFPKLFHRRATKHDTISSLEEPIFSGFQGRYLWIYPSSTPFQMDAALMLTSRGHDINHDRGVGQSLMHELICGDTSSSLVLHNRDLGLDKTTPFPWHLLPSPFVDIAFLVTRFRHFRRLLSTDDFTRIMNMQPDRGISPLCWAARMNRLDIMDHCLEMGANIDFEGMPFGSALMVACSYGQLDSVKFLVRRGAQTSYIGQNGPVNVMKRTQSTIVRQWLLVGRFNEQKRITSAGYETAANWSDCVLRPWSGIREARLMLTGRREMLPHESSFDYAKKLATIRRDMRGKIVPDLIR